MGKIHYNRFSTFNAGGHVGHPVRLASHQDDEVEPLLTHLLSREKAEQGRPENEVEIFEANQAYADKHGILLPLPMNAVPSRSSRSKGWTGSGVEPLLPLGVC